LEHYASKDLEIIRYTRNRASNLQLHPSQTIHDWFAWKEVASVKRVWRSDKWGKWSTFHTSLFIIFYDDSFERQVCFLNTCYLWCFFIHC